ncbi:MAG: OmpA family protein [Clostridia bacterium]|nr:OmpA family protein [Clostridia bacterium]
MARQQVHHRRGRGDSGASWISYSDIMAALVLVFVLFLVYNLHQYNQMLQIKTRELETQQALLLSQEQKLQEQAGILIIQQADLDAASAALTQAQLDLEQKQDELQQQTIILIGKQDELDEAKATLAIRETELNSLQLQLSAQKELFDAQTRKLEEMVGVRSQIVRDLSQVLSRSRIAATVDQNTGDITLESKVFFQTNSFEIREDGKELLDRFVPVYLGVLLQDQYRDYIGEIIVEGHTDSTGTYLKNLQLSQSRALAVAQYCLTMPGLSGEQQALLQKILTAKGRSSNDLVYNPDGTENMEASRRVEFKFNLKDAEMIEEMNRILTMDAAGGAQ